MSNKTDRKNKTNLSVNWPTHGECFTIAELLANNPDFVEITLRVRVDRAIKKDGMVKLVGHKNVGKGRPKMMLAMEPVSKELLEKAYNQDGIQPPDVMINKPLVNVINVSTPVAVQTSESEETDDTTVEIPAIETTVNS